MKKLSLALFITLLSFVLFSNFNVAQAEELDTSSTLLNSEIIMQSEQQITPLFINDFRYRKVNVSYSDEWSGYARVSDDLNTIGAAGGNITATRSHTFGTTVTGDIYGLDVSTSTSITNTMGYTMNVGPNKIVFLGYRVKYRVEKGTREHYDLVTGKVMSSNSYTVRTPQYGEYALINTR